MDMTTTEHTLAEIIAIREGLGFPAWNTEALYAEFNSWMPFHAECGEWHHEEDGC